MGYSIGAPKALLVGVAAALTFASLPALAQVPTKPKAVPQSAKPASPVPKIDDNDVVARIDSITLSANDVRAYIADLGDRERAALAQDPALLNQAIRLTLTNRLVLQELQAKKWDQRAEVVAQLDRVRQNALIELYLQAASTPPANFPSEEDLQKVYDGNRNAFLMPRQFQLAEILIRVPKDADKATGEQAKGQIDDIQRKLKVVGTDFAAIATENGAPNGGNLGWVVEGQINPEIKARVAGLARNAMSEPIRLEDGWRIVKLVDTKEPYTRTLPEVRDQLVQQIRGERAKALRQAYLGELLRQHPPVLNEFALSNLIERKPR